MKRKQIRDLPAYSSPTPAHGSATPWRTAAAAFCFLLCSRLFPHSPSVVGYSYGNANCSISLVKPLTPSQGPCPVPSAERWCLYFPGVPAFTCFPDIMGISHLLVANSIPILLHFLFPFLHSFTFVVFSIFISVGISAALGGRHHSAILNPSRLFFRKSISSVSFTVCF